MNIIVKGERNLPHLMPIGSSFFVTWRLFGSIPKEKILQFKAQLEVDLKELDTQKIATEAYQLEKIKLQNAYYQQFENILDYDKGGNHFLKEAQIAEIIINKLKEFDEKYYHLDAFCVMSNHVHALFNFSAQLPEKMIDFDEKNYVQLSQVMKLIKGSTAFYANKILGRKGSFWEEESFDTYIRSEKHRQTVKEYIINNPVKAKICKHWEDYPYTYLKL